MSGTSFSAPHVAGVVALLLDLAPGIKDPLRVKEIIESWAAPGVVTDPKGSPNRLLRQGIYMAPGNQPPLAEYDMRCDPIAHVCRMTGSRSLDDRGPANLSFLWTTDVGRPSKTHFFISRYGNEGYPNTFAETLTVTDAGGLKASITKPVRIP